MEGFCRGCLNKYDDPAALLQYTEKNKRLYAYSTGLQVKRNDALPFHLCRECYVNMRMACKFKKLCRNSDKKLKNYLALKDGGEVEDLCTFLKSNDDSLTFRFPLMSANSTPARKTRDEDNESTCTSIRNFMNDILHAEDIPDTEARIICEVIEEEADILDDSLDSHWLQDDVSIDTDFQLDFNFSSTPWSTNNDRYDTPQKLKEQIEQQNFAKFPRRSNESVTGKTASCRNIQQELTLNEIDIINGDIPKKVEEEGNGYLVQKESEENYLAVKNIPLESNESNLPLSNGEVINTVEISEKPTNVRILTKIEEDLAKTDPNKTNNQILKSLVDENVISYDTSDKNGKLDFTIDKNLEAALKDEGTKEFPLESLILTPVYNATSGASTPTINNILFGDKLTLNSVNVDLKSGQTIEQFENVDGDIDILEDFFKNNSENNTNANEESENVSNTVGIKSNETEDVKYSLKDFFCKTCDKKFDSLRAIKVHLTKKHLHRLQPPRINKKIQGICDYCGKSFNDHGNLVKHIVRHMIDQKVFKCNKCNLRFRSAPKLKMHMSSHLGGKRQPKQSSENKYVCHICSAAFASTSNLKVHLMRHNKEYKVKCPECDKGFYRNTDLVTHIRSHTKQRPFKCEQCDFRSARRDVLSRHIKLHLDEKPHSCRFCGTRYVRLSELGQHLKKSKACVRLQIKMALDEQSKVPDFVVHETKAYVSHNENGSVLAEECKITDLMSIPDVDEDSMDIDEGNDTTNLQEVISDIVTT